MRHLAVVIMILVAALSSPLYRKPTTARLLIAIQMFLLITLASNLNLIGGMTPRGLAT
ncbi:MAG: hypothetical protein Q9O62_02980 [Ardenticatenia bacterium]|nr:hypothetical protein [Ardenticatenia bacterium]